MEAIPCLRCRWLVWADEMYVQCGTEILPFVIGENLDPESWGCFEEA